MGSAPRASVCLGSEALRRPVMAPPAAACHLTRRPRVSQARRTLAWVCLAAHGGGPQEIRRCRRRRRQASRLGRALEVVLEGQEGPGARHSGSAPSDLASPGLAASGRASCGWRRVLWRRGRSLGPGFGGFGARAEGHDGAPGSQARGGARAWGGGARQRTSPEGFAPVDGSTALSAYSRGFSLKY